MTAGYTFCQHLQVDHKWINYKAFGLHVTLIDYLYNFLTESISAFGAVEDLFNFKNAPPTLHFSRRLLVSSRGNLLDRTWTRIEATSVRIMEEMD